MTRNLTVLLLLAFAAVLQPECCEASTKIVKVVAEIELLELSLYRFGTDVCRLPTTEEGLRPLDSPTKDMPGWRGPYLKKNLPIDPWGHEYQYHYPPKYGNRKFDLYSFGANGKDDHGEGDDISNWKDYDRAYYGDSSWSYQQIILLLLLADFPAVVLIYLGVVLSRRYRRTKGLQTK
jgi:general secretion pathway protein G